MTDFEIARKVGDILKLEWAKLDNNYHPLCYWENGELQVFDPCNDPEQAFPIILENWITIHQDPVNAFRWAQHGDIIERDTDNVLRAAMKVFIRMKS